MSDDQLWLHTFGPAEAPIRLVCVPHAGAGMSHFAGWRSLLPGDVALDAVQLPGREGRWRERPLTDLATAAEILAPYVLARAGRAPVVLFGHSMGGLLAYALAGLLAAAGRPAAHVVVSGCQPSDRPLPRRRIGHLPDDDFVAAIGGHGGLPTELAASARLMELFLPTLRADVRMAEAYFPDPARPLHSPLTAFGGDRDTRVPWAAVREWRHYTVGGFAERLFPGPHLFIRPAQDEVVAAVRAVLEGVRR
ncbi:thioesterase II family protein [Plantactinospora sp. KLBMP9567]|uniref:thioesterase II family protein n=1 Tax=Plantactinospora sp. KLBMP9567 TaxID=3085900 RepID=UPI002981F011|nr:alpha/beta fold hydrolase [Plantactinospora sp. KLBMP9567]MDW5324867.1 alpha/beta fold hydrolase [Plantactinospora sp. KLBMP9567]